MDEILGTIGDAVGSIVDNPVVQFGFQLFAIYWVVLWLAAAYWAFRDMQLRSENPIVPYLASAFIIVFTPIGFPLAIFAYRIVRPQERIGEIYERNLAEEAMLAEIEAIRHCPSCDRRVDAGWIICPTCRTRLNRVCPNCMKLVGLDWSLCAWCGKDFERLEGAVAPTAAVRAPVREALPEPAAGRSAVAEIRTSVRASRAAGGGSGGVAAGGAGAGPATARSADSLAES
ncbi:MAG TPA: zinc ribbon domain-containing protein [Candidatus Sulfomarinibacteraceae bacterium]|nr:zinc ribbon domain-containing protein [Candidatus Sulfomarinibacteraceae bacterium]